MYDITLPLREISNRRDYYLKRFGERIKSYLLFLAGPSSLPSFTSLDTGTLVTCAISFCKKNVIQRCGVEASTKSWQNIYWEMPRRCIIFSSELRQQAVGLSVPEHSTTHSTVLCTGVLQTRSGHIPACPNVTELTNDNRPSDDSSQWEVSTYSCTQEWVMVV